MLKEGQVLWLKLRFNNNPGDVSSEVHPYIIYDIDNGLSTVEIIQCDSIDGKLHKAYMKENHFISANGETVFSKHGFAQLDNCFMVELSENLEKYRKTEDTLSGEQFSELKREYVRYQLTHQISDNKTVYVSNKELERLNK